MAQNKHCTNWSSLWGDTNEKKKSSNVKTNLFKILKRSESGINDKLSYYSTKISCVCMNLKKLNKRGNTEFWKLNKTDSS